MLDAEISALQVRLERASTIQEFAPSLSSAWDLLNITNEKDRRESSVIAKSLLPVISATAHRLIYSVPNGQPSFKICLEMLCIPILFKHFNWQPHNLRAWSELLQNVAKAVPRPVHSLPVLLAFLIMEGVVKDPRGAFVNLLTRFTETDAEHLRGSFKDHPNVIGAMLGKYQWFQIKAMGQPIANTIETLKARDPLNYAHQILYLIYLLGLRLEESLEWLEVLFHQILLPSMKVARAVPSFALILERHAYTLIQKVETADYFRSIYKQLEGPLTEAGRLYAQQIPSTPAVRTTEPPRVAFLINSGCELAHGRALTSLLHGLKDLPVKPVEAYVYMGQPLASDVAYMTSFAEEVGAKFFVPPDWREKQGFDIDTVAWLKQRCIADDIAALVFVSVPLYVCFLAAARVAPVSIWWAMKYHGMRAEDLNGYVTHAIHQKRPAHLPDYWRLYDIGYPPLVDASLADKARELRTKFGADQGAVIVGFLGRAERLSNKNYVSALARILRACPNAVYLWTGRTQPVEFLEMLQKEGVEDRCRHIGWINTKLYAQVFDIQIDPFPFASGFTAAECMAVGKPSITLITPEAMESSTAAYVVPLYRGEVGTVDDQNYIKDRFGPALFPYCATVDEYVALATRLIQDAALRRRVGEACVDLVERYLSNEKRFAETACQQFADIIRETLDGPLPKAAAAGG